jgi:uncharacterized membrane protein YbhN (UPF0104 family)
MSHASSSNATTKPSSATQISSKKWQWIKRVLTVIFFILVPVLLFILVKNIEWTEVKQALHFRAHKITLPKIQLAFVQAGLAITNWLLMGLLIFTLMPDKVDYQTILGILLISSLAGIVAHIPAGLGVLETVFITMLHHQLSKGSILAALIGYRLIYFLLPLAIACIIYFIFEARAKKILHKNSPPATQ